MIQFSHPAPLTFDTVTHIVTAVQPDLTEVKGLD